MSRGSAGDETCFNLIWRCRPYFGTWVYYWPTCPSGSVVCAFQGMSVNFWMTANWALDSAESGALPGRSTTMACTLACVAASASVQMWQSVSAT
jgi:hypothetical protein